MTKTPCATIRRIVQDTRFFFKIKPGLWALKSYKNKLPGEIISQWHAKSYELMVTESKVKYGKVNHEREINGKS